MSWNGRRDLKAHERVEKRRIQMFDSSTGGMAMARGEKARSETRRERRNVSGNLLRD